MIKLKKNFEKLIIECLCKEYQSIWFCNVETKEITVYKTDSSDGITEMLLSQEESIKYDWAMKAYIEKFTLEDQREKLIEDTTIDKVVSELKKSGNYIVEYQRLVDNKINYNQMFFGIIDPEEESFTHFLMGFRDYDYKRKAEVDELTGIYNRKGFFWHAEKTLRENPDKTYDLILSDYVNFKDYNEKYGTKMGDALLAGAGRYLSYLSNEGAVVGRYGGDQFVVLLESSQYDSFIARTATISPVNADGLPDAEVKFGICKGVDRDKSIVLYCDRAHIAVNTIKHVYGQKIAEFDEGIRDMVEKQRAIEADMQKAIDEKQFKVYYQPKHDTVTGKLVGAEALVRWIHPEYGFMSPADFIPVFERNGFIVKLDNYVFERTCENIRRWINEGKTVVPISINASKLTIESQGIVFFVNKAMRKYNIPGNYLHLEITESLMGDDTELLIRRLEPLKEKGILIELDDFGSGYSSINMLSSLPLDVIKLDMSFMRQFGDYKRAKVLEACVNLAKNLGYKTVSEGVETSEQLEALKTLGVDIIQGFYYSKPLPEGEFEEYAKGRE